MLRSNGLVLCLIAQCGLGASHAALATLKVDANSSSSGLRRDSSTELHQQQAPATQHRDSLHPELIPASLAGDATILQQPEQCSTSCLACFAGGLCLGIVGTAVTIMFLGEYCGRTKLNTSEVDDGNKSAAHVSQASSSGPLLPDTGTEPFETGHKAEKEQHHSATETIESMHLFWPRVSCLIILLLIQSISSFILEGFQDTMARHPSILHFLTMLIGTGGNCGGQSVVLAVRRLATGDDTSFMIMEQAFIGLCLAAVLAPLAFVRSWMQSATIVEAVTIAVAIAVLVVIATSLGTALPKLMVWLRVDPAHASPAIQVGMDIVGVSIVCLATWALLSHTASVISAQPTLLEYAMVVGK